MIDLSTFSANSTGQLDVLGHYGDTFGVDGTQVGVLEQTDQVGFASLLKSQHSGALKPQVGFEILCDFLTPPVAGALFLAALVANCLRGAFPPGDFRAVCFVRAMTANNVRENTKSLTKLAFVAKFGGARFIAKLLYSDWIK